MDPISVALKSASTAYDLCKGTYQLIQGVKKAPADVRRVATDLKGFYGVLGALQHNIQDQRSVLDEPRPASYQLQNVAALLDDCVAAFKELQERVQGFVAVNGKIIQGATEGLKWDQFEKDDVQYLRSHLSNIKLSLNIALSSLTLFVVSRTSQQSTQTQHKVILMRQELQQLRLNLHPSAPKSSVAGDLGSVRLSRLSIASTASFASLATASSLDDSIETFIHPTEPIVDSVEINGNAGTGTCTTNSIPALQNRPVRESTPFTPPMAEKTGRLRALNVMAWPWHRSPGPWRLVHNDRLQIFSPLELISTFSNELGTAATIRGTIPTPSSVRHLTSTVSLFDAVKRRNDRRLIRDEGARGGNNVYDDGPSPIIVPARVDGFGVRKPTTSPKRAGVTIFSKEEHHSIGDSGDEDLPLKQLKYQTSSAQGYASSPERRYVIVSIATHYRRDKGRPKLITTLWDDREDPPVETYQRFLVAIDDTCKALLPVALKRYNITDDWRQYSLYIVHGDQERCLGLEEKPLQIFKQLDGEGKKPMFMLRRHASPQERWSGAAGGEIFSEKKLIPGGVL